MSLMVIYIYFFLRCDWNQKNDSKKPIGFFSNLMLLIPTNIFFQCLAFRPNIILINITLENNSIHPIPPSTASFILILKVKLSLSLVFTPFVYPSMFCTRKYSVLLVVIINKFLQNFLDLKFIFQEQPQSSNIKQFIIIKQMFIIRGFSFNPSSFLIICFLNHKI